MIRYYVNPMEKSCYQVGPTGCNAHIRRGNHTMTKHFYEEPIRKNDAHEFLERAAQVKWMVAHLVFS